MSDPKSDQANVDAMNAGIVMDQLDRLERNPQFWRGLDQWLGARESDAGKVGWSKSQ